MPESDKDTKNGDTIKISINPADVELTQKIDIDYEKVVDESKKEALISEIRHERESTKDSLTGKAIFTRKRITDDYVKSSTIISMIGEVPPLKDKLELQDIHNNYELKDQFSEGAQGIIRIAFDKSLKRDVVVKSLKVDEVEEHARADESLFVSEARIMAQLDHPSIIPLYGLHSGTESKLHLAMKHIHGKTLKQYLEDVVTLYEREGIEQFDEKRSISTRIEYLIKVCEAIDYAHCKGVVHRDLKPENIMIGNYGEVYVMDWGLACLVEPEKFSDKAHHDDVGRYGKSELVGTPCYIAPELIRGGACSQKSDVFALGMILFEIITLNRAVPGKTVKEVLTNIVNWNYRPFKHRFLKNKLPDDLKAIVAKAICEQLAHRYKSANDMAKDLRLYLMREETAARPDNIFRKCMRAMVNHKMLTSIVVMSILLCLAASTIYSLHSQNVLIIEQKIRENMLADFQGYASQRANRMERMFFYFKTQLSNAAIQAGHLLSSKVISEPRDYLDMSAFLNPSTTPADYVYSPAYGVKMSLDYAVLKKGIDSKPEDKINKRIVALTKTYKHIMFSSDMDFADKPKSVIKKIIINRGAPLIWIFMGLKNGSMFSYPGKPYAKNYDPRKRPWYKDALKQKQKIAWAEPYKCIVSSKIVVSCTQRVYNENNIFQGIIAMDISLDYIQKHIFNEKAGSVLKEYLLNKKSKVILSSDFEDKNARTSKRATLVLKKFPFYEEVQDAIKEEKVQFEAEKYGIKYIFTLHKLPALGYYYIQQISEKKLRYYWEKSTSYKKK
jgi:eukaryotic-like serine/threonine-protein kinase